MELFSYLHLNNQHMTKCLFFFVFHGRNLHRLHGICEIESMQTTVSQKAGGDFSCFCLVSGSFFSFWMPLAIYFTTSPGNLFQGLANLNVRKCFLMPKLFFCNLAYNLSTITPNNSGFPSLQVLQDFYGVLFQLFLP